MTQLSLYYTSYTSRRVGFFNRRKPAAKFLLLVPGTYPGLNPGTTANAFELDSLYNTHRIIIHIGNTYTRP